MPVRSFTQYRPAPKHFDEAFARPRQARPHWKALIEAIAQTGTAGLRRKTETLRRAVELDGITYNVYADPKGSDRPWTIDPLPLVIEAGEWRGIAAGIAQRAELLNAILADVYGPRQMLAEGLLPPALAFGHPGYLWPCQGIEPPGGTWLHLYAADLARSEDGRWWVIHDRTQGPSGTGYAMQNRQLTTRSWLSLFREMRVEHLTEFIHLLRENIVGAAPTPAGETPMAVLLTPGPLNETYFEHSMLARHLGFPLVEGQDLTVRDARVYLKTLQGLRPVHAILRRLDDDYCDPVELRSDSALGVPGLLSAVRAGKVLVANALGSGLLETTGLQGFLPAICRRLLNKPLAMPSVATWWCGEAPALEYVLGHLDELVIKPAFPSMHMEPVFGHLLDDEGRARLAQRLRATPHAFQAQEWIRLSNAPTVREDGAVISRAIGMRVFALATADGYVVMPGGLARVAPDDSSDVVTMQRGGASKDVWVCSDRPVSRDALANTPIAPHELVRTAAVVPSRIAENLYWLGRYSERCETQLRLLRAALNRLSDPGEGGQRALESLAGACRFLGILPGREKDEPVLPSDAIWMSSVFSIERGNSLASNTRRLQRAGNQIRERLSGDNWHALNRLPQILGQTPHDVAGAVDAMDRMMLLCVSFAGFAMDDMTRDDSWRFLLLGRRIERLAGLAGLLGHFLRSSQALRDDGLEWLLEATDSIITYRSRYQREPELLPVLDLVVFDECNPHALGFQLEALSRYLVRIGRDYGASFENDPRQLHSLLMSFDPTRFHNLGLLTSAAPGGDPVDALAGFASRASLLSLGLSDEISLRFFSHADRAMQSAEAA